MSLGLIILIASSLLTLVIGSFVLLKNPKSVTNQLFTILCLSLCGWTVANYLSVNVTGNDLIFFMVKCVFFFVIIQNTSFFLLMHNFPHTAWRGNKKLIITYVIFSLLVEVMLFANLFFSGYKPTATSIELVVSPLIIVFLLHTIFSIFGGFFFLVRNFLRSRGIAKEQFRILIYASVLLLVLVPTTNFVFPVFFGINPFVNFGPVYTLLFALAMGYAIVANKLFDIRAAVARSFAFILSVITIGLVYGFLAFLLVARILPNNTSITTLQIIYTLLAVVLAFTFQPIRNFFVKISNSIFYRDKYSGQVLVNEVGRILASEIDLDKASNRVLHEITNQIKIDKGEIVVFGQKQLFYENNVFKNSEKDISPTELKKLGRLLVVADQLGSGDRKELLEKYGVKVSLALRTSEKFIGYMLLGEKKNGDIYTDGDLEVLKIVANEISVAIANALSYKEIQLFSETLAEKVRERTAQLRNANDQLKELDKAKDEFISMASHQLRTPLTTVKGYASMLEEGDFGKLSKDQKDTIELTLDGANRMTRLIDDLLNVSRMDANRFFLEADKVDIAKLVTEELGQLKTLAESKQIELTYNAPKQKIPIIVLDENKTRQVVMNITDNAIHYSSPPSGGGHVHVSLELKGDHIEYLVQDDGIGVPIEAQKHLFTKMFRAQNARGVRPDGTGLGLYLVKRVVEEQGGEIIFHSEPGKGSTFGFKLPLSGIPKEVLEQSKKIGARVTAHPK